MEDLISQSHPTKKILNFVCFLLINLLKRLNFSHITYSRKAKLFPAPIITQNAIRNSITRKCIRNEKLREQEEFIMQFILLSCTLCFDFLDSYWEWWEIGVIFCFVGKT